MAEGLIVKGIQFLDWRSISLNLDLGECGGISGASGSGKSLLLRAISDLIEFEGSVTWRGDSHRSLSAPAWRQRVGVLPANPVWWHDRVGDHFVHDVSVLLRELGFDDDVLGWEIARLSSGEKQRLALVRLLERRPECLLLDEPTANLDAESSHKVENVIRGHLRRNADSAAVLLVSHDQHLLSRICQHQWHMKDCELIDLDSAKS
jgi:ABC-type iron transport system FetAB ATPase subunit